MDIAKLKFAHRIAFAAGLPLILLLAVSTVAVLKLQRLSEDTVEVVYDRVPKLERAADWSISLLQSARHSRNLLILDDRTAIRAEVDGLMEERNKRGTLIEWLTKHVVSPSSRATLTDLKEARAKYSASEQTFIELVEAGRSTEAKTLLLAETRPLQLAYLKGIDAFRGTQQTLAKTQGETAQSTYSSGLAVLLTLSGIALGSGIAIGVVVTRSVTRQLGGEPAYAAAAARRIAEGDLASTVQVKRGDTTSLLVLLCQQP